MIKKRAGVNRGFEDKKWIQSYHSFSFDNYYDPEYLSFRNLRVLNEEYIQGGKGLGEQFYKDMILCTYVISGMLEYKDKFGNTKTIRPGELFILTSGTGTPYRIYNLSPHESVHFYQFWFNPDQNGLSPSIEQKVFPSAAKWGQWCLMASQNTREGSLRIHQDVDLYSTWLEKDDSLKFESLADRYYWIQIASGKFMIQKDIVSAGDGLSFVEESEIDITCFEEGEIILIDQA